MKQITEKSILEFSQSLKAEEKAPATVEKYIKDAEKFKKFCDECKLSHELVIKYKNYLTESYAPSSVNSHISSLNCFFDFLGVPELKLKSLKLQKQLYTEIEKELTKAEYEQLLCAASMRKRKRLYYILQTICACGIRVSETGEIHRQQIQKLGLLRC